MEKGTVQHVEKPQLLFSSPCFPALGGVCQILDVIYLSCYFKAIFKDLRTPVFLGQSPQKEPEVLKFSCFDGACSYSNLFRPNKCVGFVQITSAPLIAILASEFFVTGKSLQPAFFLIVWHLKKSAQSFLLPSWQGTGRLQCTDLGHELICCGFR